MMPQGVLADTMVDEQRARAVAALLGGQYDEVHGLIWVKRLDPRDNNEVFFPHSPITGEECSLGEMLTAGVWRP